jgi:hypothetical protein
MRNTIGNIAEPTCICVRCCKTTCTTPDTGDHKLETDIKELDGAIDYHTVENRNKRKALHPTRALGAFTVRLAIQLVDNRSYRDSLRKRQPSKSF